MCCPNVFLLFFEYHSNIKCSCRHSRMSSIKVVFFFFFLTSLFFFFLLILIISQYLKTTKLPCILYSLHANRALQSICNSVLGVSHLPLGFRFVSSPIMRSASYLIVLALWEASRSCCKRK